MPRIGKKKYYKCSVKGCTKLPNDVTFSFPSNELRSRLWLERCGNESLYQLSTKKLATSKKVCQKHFARHAFTNDLRNRLNFDAVPSILPHIPPVIVSDVNNVQGTESTEEILLEAYHLPVASSAHSEEIPPPASTEVIMQEQHNLPVPSTANTEGILNEDSYIIIMPEPSLVYTEEIPKEVYYLPVPSPANSENIPKAEYYSKVLSVPNSHVGVKSKSSNYLPRESPQPCESTQNVRNFKQYINKNNHEQNNLCLEITKGNGIPDSEQQCDVKSMDVFQSCGLAFCNDDLYSDAKNVKQLVKCSSKCARFFHLACTGLEKVEYDILCNNDALRWFCKECRMRP